jgi:hypothetical protein
MYCGISRFNKVKNKFGPVGAAASGSVLVGGLITLQLLTLYITPDCHVYLDKTARFAGGVFGRKAGVSAEAG